MMLGLPVWKMGWKGRWAGCKENWFGTRTRFFPVLQPSGSSLSSDPAGKEVRQMLPGTTRTSDSQGLQWQESPAVPLESMSVKERPVTHWAAGHSEGLWASPSQQGERMYGRRRPRKQGRTFWVGKSLPFLVG